MWSVTSRQRGSVAVGRSLSLTDTGLGGCPPRQVLARWPRRRLTSAPLCPLRRRQYGGEIDEPSNGRTRRRDRRAALDHACRRGDASPRRRSRRAPNVGDAGQRRGRAETSAKPLRHVSIVLCHGDAEQHLDARARHRCCERIAHERRAVHERAALTTADHAGHRRRAQRRRHGDVPAGHRLIGADRRGATPAWWLAKSPPRAAEPGRDLIEDEQHVVGVAQLAQSTQIAGAKKRMPPAPCTTGSRTTPAISSRWSSKPLELDPAVLNRCVVSQGGGAGANTRASIAENRWCIPVTGSQTDMALDVAVIAIWIVSESDARRRAPARAAPPSSGNLDGH